MLVSTPMSVSQFGNEVDEALDMPANADVMFSPENLVADRLSDNPPSDNPPSDNPPSKKDNESQSPELSAEDEEERRWWAKVEALGKIRDCARMIEEVEAEVDGYQDQIKESKEVLKGQQALLARYSSQLADILDGHPLPKNPNAPAVADGADPLSDPASGADWRDMPTDKLLEGTKGLGAKKLEAIMELAPTAGKLEDLRDQASRAHEQFKTVLPKGCGEAMADEIENRLMDHIAKWADTVDDRDEAKERDGIAASDDCDRHSEDEPYAIDDEEYDDVD